MRYYRFWAGKKQNKYLEAPKLKMAAQFKMAAKILFTSKTYKPSFYKFFNILLYKKKFSKIQDGAHVRCFFAIFF
jgi:hypothetical protein